MGWTTMNYNGTAKNFFLDRYRNEPNFEIVDIAIKNFRTAYIAIKNLKEGYVYCQTYLLHRAPKSYENFGYKPVSEFCGPVTAECPKRILDKLTPLDEIVEMSSDVSEKSVEWARGWRERCRKNIEASKKLKNSIVKTDEPLEFRSGNSYQYFKRKGKKWFAIANYGTKAEFLVPVSISGWRNIPYTLV